MESRFVKSILEPSAAKRSFLGTEKVRIASNAQAEVTIDGVRAFVEGSMDEM